MSKKENTLGNFLRLHHILKLFSLLIELLAMILGCASICSWMFYKWVFNNFGGGLGVDQVLWTIKFSTTGADQALLTSIYNSVYLCVALCLLWICAVYFFKRPTFIKKLLKKLKAAILASIRVLNKFRHWHHYRKVYFAVGGLLLILIPAFSLLNALKNVNKRYSVVEYFENQQNTDGCDFIRDNYKIPSADSVIFNKKNNLVIVLGESLESNFNSSVPLAPELDKLSKSARSASGLINTRGSTWTIGAITGWHFGLPLKLPIGENDYHSPRGFLPNALSIFDILKANGYKTILVMGSDKRFSGMEELFRSHGDFTIYDSTYLEKKGWDRKKYHGTNWGYSDAFVFERAKEVYDELSKQNEPFVLFIETMDTLMPEGWCPEEKRIFGDLRDAYLEADRQIASFANHVLTNSEKPTVLAIIGDHYFMGDPYMFKGIERRIRNLFFGDLPEVPEEKQSQFISPVDMAPTILEAAGASWGSSQFGIGVSIFSKDKSLIEKVGQKEYNSKVSLPSALYLTFY